MATSGQNGNPEHWRALYIAALHEASGDELPQRIRDAEKAIVDEIQRAGGFQMHHQPLLDALLALLDLEKISRLDGHAKQSKRSVE